MAKWTRVGEIPKKIPVNFVVDSEKYPELAAWIYSFPHGEMGKTVREILNHHATLEAGGDEPQPGGQSGDDARVRGGGRNPPRPTLQVEPAVRAPTEGGEEVRGMDAGTASTLRQLDQGF